MFYVYRFLDKSKNVIYVGKSKQELEQRFKGHTHLPDECYSSVYKIEFISCSTETDMNIKEIYYINKYKNENGYFNLLDVADIPKSVEFNDKWKMYRGSLPSHFSKSINYKKRYSTEKETRFNKDGSVDKRIPNKVAGESSYVEALTKDEVNFIIDYFVNRINSASDNTKRKVWFRNLVMFVFNISIPLMPSEFTNLKYKDVFDNKDNPKSIEMKLNRFHKDESIFIPLRKIASELLVYYRNCFDLNFNDNADDYLFISRNHHVVTMKTWGNILKESAEAVGIKKNINSESIRKTYGLNIYKTSKNKIKAIQFLGEIWGHQREAQIIKYLNLVKTEVDFDFFFGEKFNLCEIDLKKIEFINNYGYIYYKNGKPTIKIINEKLQTEKLISKIDPKPLYKSKKKSTALKSSSDKVLQNKNNKSKKISREIKLEIIKKYLSGESTQKALAIEYDVTISSISRWVNDYKKYGEVIFG